VETKRNAMLMFARREKEALCLVTSDFMVSIDMCSGGRNWQRFMHPGWKEWERLFANMEHLHGRLGFATPWRDMGYELGWPRFLWDHMHFQEIAYIMASCSTSKWSWNGRWHERKREMK